MTAPTQPPLLTHSEMVCFQRCPREHHYRYRLLRRAQSEGNALIFGKLIDECLQVWWENFPSGRDRMLAKLDAMQADEFDRAKARALLLGYDARWANEPYDVIAVQPTFRTSIVNPETGKASQTYELGGKLDVLVRDRNTSEIVIIETKTTSDDIAPTSAYWSTISALDPQISTYYVGAREILDKLIREKAVEVRAIPKRAAYQMSLNVGANRCVYDVIRKPQLRPLKATPVESRQYKKGGGLYANQREKDELPEEYFERIAQDILETPSKYYARGDVVRLEQDEIDHAQDVWHTARLIRENELLKRAPRFRGSCKRYGRLCSYFAVCSGSARIESFPLVEEKHTELKEI